MRCRESLSTFVTAYQILQEQEIPVVASRLRLTVHLDNATITEEPKLSRRRAER
jgi:hypothetical protein